MSRSALICGAREICGDDVGGAVAVRILPPHGTVGPLSSDALLGLSSRCANTMDSALEYLGAIFPAAAAEGCGMSGVALLALLSP